MNSNNQLHSRPACREPAWIGARAVARYGSRSRLLLEFMAILAFGALARLVFFPGGLGTDEIVYLTRALHLLQGEYPHTTYIGAMRDGISVFLAGSIYLFGPGRPGASGLFFACSLGQVALAFGFAYHLWGRRAAIWSALAMVAAPIAVAGAGNLSPDPYLGFVIACSVIVFYFAERDDRPQLYLAAGLLAGWVFWIKQAAIVYGIVFLFLALADRRWRAGRLWFVLGGITALLIHLVLFWMIYGDPFYFFETYYEYINDVYVSRNSEDTSLWTYLVLLIFRIYHIGLLGWLALAGWIQYLLRRNEAGIRFVVIWGLGLLLIFSALPISFSPLKFIAKQSNYILIFLLPLALMAGWFLAQQRRAVALVLGSAMILSGVILAALEQQVISAVTVNGRSAAAFAAAHAGTPVFGPLTAQRQSQLQRVLQGSLDGSRDIHPLGDLSRFPLTGGSADEVTVYVIEDPQMRNWPAARRGSDLPGLLECQIEAGELAPSDFGHGRLVLAWLRNMISLLPGDWAEAGLRLTEPIWDAPPAEVYGVTRQCALAIRAPKGYLKSAGGPVGAD